METVVLWGLYFGTQVFDLEMREIIEQITDLVINDIVAVITESQLTFYRSSQQQRIHIPKALSGKYFYL